MTDNVISNLIRLIEAIVDVFTNEKIAILLFSIINLAIAVAVLFFRSVEGGAWLVAMCLIMDAILLGMVHKI